jgi:hypothetical protein
MLHETSDLGGFFETTCKYRLIRRIVAPTTKEVTWGWRYLLTEELRRLVLFGKYYQWNQIKENGMNGTCGTHWRGRCILSFGRKSEGERPLGKQRYRQKYKPTFVFN